ncbi:MAG: molybdate ABC transporter substrate-binding protein [Flavobacteriaceae bacterium]|nr:molybdate ABC transporter substrate-binding protein [Flavobacteriaceae bacterium]
MTVNRMNYVMVIFLITILYSCNGKNSDHITIATASNIKTTMMAIKSAYESQTGTKVQLVVASSGKLTAQIKAGAPFDLFVSADMKYPELLYKDGFTVSKPKIYAYGTLILWTCKKGLKPSLSTLDSESTRYIAVANPKTAPYGYATQKVLEYYKLTNKTKDKLVYGESISQANQFIQTQNVDIGFTSKSVLYSPHLTTSGSWIALDRNSYPPIKQGIVLLKNGKEKATQEFYNFIGSRQGQLILEKHGYLVNKQ